MSITPSKADERGVRACGPQCRQFNARPGERCLITEDIDPFGNPCLPWLWAVMETQMQLKATIDRDPDGAPMSLVPIVKMQIDLQTLDDIEPICIELGVVDE